MAEETGSSGATPESGHDPAGSATRGGQQESGSGATPETGSSKEGATPDTSLGDRGREALERERGARREAERNAAEYKRKIAELEDAGKPDLERAQGQVRRHQAEIETHKARIAELESELSRRDLDAMKAQVATEFNIPPKMADRLNGTDLRSLKADARDLAEQLRSGQPVGSFRGGEGSSAVPGSGRVSMTDLIREATGR
jgi:hypothetical protein